MRKKIGKRIGPVPIALVAVFALAAFVSLGLLLVANNVTQAQEVPVLTKNLDEKKCQVTVVEIGTGTTILGPFGDSLEAGGCNVTGDEAVVEFLNEDDNEVDVAVYVTGGGDYSNVQAMSRNESIGARGIDEHLVTIDEAGTALGGVSTPGSHTITVNRDMAEDGAVYLFAYVAAINGRAFGDLGIPLDLLDDSDATVFRGLIATSAMEEVDRAIIVVNTALLSARSPVGTTGLSVEFQENEANDPYHLPDIEVATHVAGMVGVERVAVDAALRSIATIKNDPNYERVDSVPDADPPVVGTERIEMEVEAAEVALALANAAVEAVEDEDPRYFFNKSRADVVVKVVFRDTAVAAKLVGSAYDPIDEDGTYGSTLFVGRAGNEVDEGEAPDDLTATAETASVTVRIRDTRGVELKGFVDLSIDTSAEGAADAVFTASARSTYYAELGSDPNPPGTVTAQIKGLPENDPLRIPVTANFNNGELELKANIVRKGETVMVVADAYACDGDCTNDITALNDKTRTSDDPDPVIALGPGDTFFISASSVDAVGNKIDSKGALSWKVTAETDNEDDANTAIYGDDKGNTDEEIRISDGDDAVPGVYSLTVTSSDGEASEMIMITVSDDASMITVSCDPEIISTDSGLTDCTVTVTDVNGNIPSNLHEEKDKDEDTIADTVRVAVRSTDVSISGVNTSDDAELDDEGMATFSILLREDAQEGSITVFVSSEIGDEMLRASTSITYGDPPTEPGMPMNVMAMATSHDMIAVSWESPADDGGSDITGYMVQSAYMMADDMMSDWMDVDPAHMGMDMMYMDMGLMAETTYYYRVVAMNSVGMGEYSDGMAMAMTMAENMAPMAGDDVEGQMVYVGDMVEVQSNFSDPDEDMLSYSADSSDDMIATATVDDMGMVTITGVAEGMATITVTASDPGELYAMQTIMVSVMMMPSMELGAPSITSVMSDAEGMATVMLMPGDNATKHWVWAAPTDGSAGMWHGDSALAGDATMVTFSGLTGGMNHWFIAVAGRGTGADSEWS